MVLISSDIKFKSNKFLGYMIVQYNIWLTGKTKLRKKIKKQVKKANKEDLMTVRGINDKIAELIKNNFK